MILSGQCRDREYFDRWSHEPPTDVATEAAFAQTDGVTMRSQEWAYYRPTPRRSTIPGGSNLKKSRQGVH
jgi:hypothetical protein